MSAYVGSSRNLKDLKDILHSAVSPEAWWEPFESFGWKQALHEAPGAEADGKLSVSRGPDMIRKELWSFYRNKSVSAYVGSSKNLKDLKDRKVDSRLHGKENSDSHGARPVY